MKFSKTFIIASLLAGCLTPISFALNQHSERNEVKAESTKDLANIISIGARNYSLTYLGNFFFDFALSEQIFTRTGYMNDHINEFLDANNQPINIGEGIIINGQTFNYWRNFAPEQLSYPRNQGVVAFPLYANNVFNPISIEATTTSLAFKVNLDYFSMDSIVVTFKAGVFKGYYNGINYSLSEDLTYYSTLNTSTNASNGEKITFVKERQETIINAQMISVVDGGEKTASQGGKYHSYRLYTNMPRENDHAPDWYPATHYRFVYDNYLLNDVPLTTYNSWARGNSKDFTDLNDSSTQNPDYETEHPGGGTSIHECLALFIQHPTDQPNYVAIICVPNKLIEDKNLGQIEFAIREGSAWYTKDEDGNNIIGRVDRVAFKSLINEASNELENYPDLSQYSDDQKIEIATIISDAETEMTNALTQVGLNKIVASAKEQIDMIKSSEEIVEQEHIDAVIALIDEIPEEITYTIECGEKINAAMEAYATLTASEISKFPAEKLNKLYAAYEAFSALDLVNYKALSKAEIRAKAYENEYRELQQSAVNELIAITDNQIDEANNKEEVETAVKSFINALKEIPTSKELAAQELATAKANAIAELEAIDLNQYREEERAIVEEIIRNGKIAINQCKTIEEVNQLLNKIKAVINSIQNDEELTQAATLNKQIKQRNNIIIVISISSSILIIGTCLFIFMMKRRSLHQ